MAREKLYKNLTLAEKLSRYVQSIGFTPIDSRNKYDMFERKEKNGSMSYLFIGKNGAVRVNKNSKNAANSLSYTDTFRSNLAEYERDNGLV